MWEGERLCEDGLLLVQRGLNQGRRECVGRRVGRSVCREECVWEGEYQWCAGMRGAAASVPLPSPLHGPLSPPPHPLRPATACEIASRSPQTPRRSLQSDAAASVPVPSPPLLMLQTHLDLRQLLQQSFVLCKHPGGVRGLVPQLLSLRFQGGQLSVPRLDLALGLVHLCL